MINTEIYHRDFNIDSQLVKLSSEVEKKCHLVFDNIKQVSAYNQSKVIKAMQEYRVSDSHFSGSTGYGYNDRGREVIESVYAAAFGAEDALVRHQITCGTHALALCLYGVLLPGDELLSVTGKPYDTLDEVIGIRGESGTGSLKDYGVTYRQVELLENGEMDFNGIKKAINPNTKMVFIQRSRGYSWREPTTIATIEKTVNFVKNIKPDCVVMVDNCYGEFVEDKEPTDVGVDIMAGSLIKNPGGGIVLSGGYVAGKKNLVDQASYRMTVPGLGKEVGATLGQNRSLFEGFSLHHTL